MHLFACRLVFKTRKASVFVPRVSHDADGASRVTWGMTALGGKRVPPPVDNLKLPRTFPEYTECCYHLPDTCFERSTPRSRRRLKYSIFSIYTCSDVIFPYHYTCHSYLLISDNEESNISC